VRDPVAEGIVANEARLDRDTGQLERVDLDAGHLVPAHILLEHHRHEAVLDADVVQHAAPVGVGERHELVDGVERRLDVAGLIGHELRAIGRAVAGQRHAEAVDDAAARRRDEADADAVLVRQHLVAVRLHHLEEIEPPRHRGEERRLAAGEEQGATGQHVAAGDLALFRHGAQPLRKARCSAART
jgi:hypothetical protein